MTDETPSTDPKQQIPDLSGLADFQFGPAWARPGARQERPVSYPERRSGDRQGGDRRPRRDNREGRQPRGERRVDGQSGERRFNREDRTRGSFRNRRDQTPRSAMEEPTEGLRVELRPGGFRPGGPAPGSTETPPHHFPAGSCQGGHGFLRPL